MQGFREWLFEAREEYIPQGVLAGYEAAFRDDLIQLIHKTQNPTLKAHFVAMLDCPIRDSRGGCRSFSDYVLAALIKNGIHRTSDIEAAFQYIAEKLLMPRTETGEPRSTVFAGFQERGGQTPDFNPLQPRFFQYLAYAINNLRKRKVPRVANVERRPEGTLSIASGRVKDRDAAGEVSAEEIPAARPREKDFQDLIWDVKMLLKNKERFYSLPLEAMFLGMMAGERTDQQRAEYGDKTARMGRAVITSTIRSYAERTGNYALLNALNRLENKTPATQTRRQVVKAAKPVLSDKQRDYASIISVIDRLGRPVGSADLGRYRRRWLEFSPRNPSSGHRNRLEEVLACMIADGVLRATRTAAGAWSYSPGPNYDQYRGEVGAVAGSPN